ncbi:IclR family transcriptional regulator [Paenisporosarcina indica]|uniref:IclR family transcriptional regulator n=1 Tax=Paenisporosarcina indica TaxID=650093 RepID=UPI00094FAC55|nr:IclR family transcriptional regulator [Paenisporosarcina indica]
MQEKYWVPALERSDLILRQISQNPNSLRLIDLVEATSINKSSMFSLLNTMEKLGWVVKGKGDTYRLGPSLGSVSAAYFKQFNILESFFIESEESVKKIEEPIQLGILEGYEVIYLARKDATTKIRLATDPGSRFPSYASAIGKVQLTKYNHDELNTLFKDVKFEKKAPNTIKNLNTLIPKIDEYRENGFATEIQEGAVGFCCVASPIYNHEGDIMAAVSFTMLEVDWEVKKDSATKEIGRLAKSLSALAGYIGDRKDDLIENRTL